MLRCCRIRARDDSMLPSLCRVERIPPPFLATTLSLIAQTRKASCARHGDRSAHGVCCSHTMRVHTARLHAVVFFAVTTTKLCRCERARAAQGVALTDDQVSEGDHAVPQQNVLQPLLVPGCQFHILRSLLYGWSTVFVVDSSVPALHDKLIITHHHGPFHVRRDPL